MNPTIDLAETIIYIFVSVTLDSTIAINSDRQNYKLLQFINIMISKLENKPVSNYKLVSK